MRFFLWSKAEAIHGFGGSLKIFLFALQKYFTHFPPAKRQKAFQFFSCLKIPGLSNYFIRIRESCLITFLGILFKLLSILKSQYPYFVPLS